MAYTEGTCHVRGASRRCDEAPCRNAKHVIMYLCCDLGTGFGAGLEAREDFSDSISGFINSRRMPIKWESAGMCALKSLRECLWCRNMSDPGICNMLKWGNLKRRNYPNRYPKLSLGDSVVPSTVCVRASQSNARLKPRQSATIRSNHICCLSGSLEIAFNYRFVPANIALLGESHPIESAAVLQIRAHSVSKTRLCPKMDFGRVRYFGPRHSPRSTDIRGC